MLLTDPAFPHGRAYGYTKGCRATYPCPATPTCADMQAAGQRRRAAGGSDAPGEQRTIHLRRRLTETLSHDTPGNLLERCPTLTPEDLNYVLTTDSCTVAYRISEPLDAAWAWVVHARDTEAEDFPHGTQTGYSYMCRCRGCTTAAAKTADRIKRGVGSDLTLVTDPAVLRRLTRHVRALAAPGWSAKAIGRAAGLSYYPPTKALRGEAVSAKAAAALLAVTPEQVEAAVTDGSRVPAAPAQHYVRTMWALGYPMQWIGEQIGLDKKGVSAIGTRADMLAAHKAKKVAALARRIGDRAATPEDGIDPVSILRARLAARKAGWYPPAAYDDEMRLDPRSIPGHKWAIADEWCARQVEANYRLSLGWSHTKAAEAAGITPDALQARPKHGLVYVNDGVHGVSLDYDACGDRIAQFHDVYSRFEANEVSAVTAAIELGVIRADFRTYWGDHPEVLAWVATEAAENTLEVGQTLSSTHVEAA